MEKQIEPMSVVSWLEQNGVTNSARRQAHFVGTLSGLVRCSPLVIGVHTSNRVVLPVYRFDLDDGTVVVMRGNYYRWDISVKSGRMVPDLFLDLFVRTQPACGKEGMKDICASDSYAQNRSSFSLELRYREHELYTFLFILGYALGLR